MKNKKNKGITLVETLLYLAIVVSVIASIFVLYRQVTGKSKASEEVQAMTELKNNIINAYSIRGSNQSLNCNYIMNNLLPKGLTHNNCKIESHLLGTTTVKLSTAYGNTSSSGNFLRLYHQGLNKSACMTLAEKAKKRFKIILIGSNLNTSASKSQAIKYFNGSISPQKIGKLCKKGNNNGVAMEAYLK